MSLNHWVDLCHQQVHMLAAKIKMIILTLQSLRLRFSSLSKTLNTYKLDKIIYARICEKNLG